MGESGRRESQKGIELERGSHGGAEGYGRKGRMREKRSRMMGKGREERDMEK